MLPACEGSVLFGIGAAPFAVPLDRYMCTHTRIPHSFANFWIRYISRIPVNFSRTRILGVLGTGTGTGTSCRRFHRRVTKSTRRKTTLVHTLFCGIPEDSGTVVLLENLPSDFRFDSSGPLNIRRGRISCGDPPLFEVEAERAMETNHSKILRHQH